MARPHRFTLARVAPLLPEASGAMHGPLDDGPLGTHA